jgi:hypothetical protein
VLGAWLELNPARIGERQSVIEILEYLEKAGVVISLFAVALIVAGFVRAA